MEKIDLAPFCAAGLDRYKLAKPWSVGEHTFASDGHILIRLPRQEDVPEGEGVSLERICKVFEKEPSEWFPVGPLDVEPIVCKSCQGKGRVFECPECGGEGEVCAATDYSEYDGISCNSCGGDGQVCRETWLAMMNKARRGEQVREEDANCEICHGTGKVWPDTGRAFGNAYFADHLLARFAGFPGVEIGPFGEEEAARCRFDGGDGIIMPKRKPSDV